MALYEITDTRTGERFLTEQQGPRKALDRVLDGRFTTRTIMSPIEALAAIKGAINLDEPVSPACEASAQAEAGTAGTGEGGNPDPVPVEGAV
jgi:hypothetical protein